MIRRRGKKQLSQDEFDNLQRIKRDAQTIEDNGYILMLTDISYIDLLENNLATSLINGKTNKTTKLK